MYIFGQISVKQGQLSDQQVDSGPWVVQLCENNSGLNSPAVWRLTPSHVWSTCSRPTGCALRAAIKAIAAEQSMDKNEVL